MKNIKQLRTIVEMKQSSLAELIGMNRSNFCSWENGKLILNYNEKIKQKALDILIPRLDEKIILKEKELQELKNLRNELR